MSFTGIKKENKKDGGKGSENEWPTLTNTKCHNVLITWPQQQQQHNNNNNNL